MPSQHIHSQEIEGSSVTENNFFHFLFRQSRHWIQGFESRSLPKLFAAWSTIHFLCVVYLCSLIFVKMLQ